MEPVRSRRTVPLAIALGALIAGGLLTALRAVHSAPAAGLKAHTQQRSDVRTVGVNRVASRPSHAAPVQGTLGGLDHEGRTGRNRWQWLQDVQASAANRLDVLWTHPGRCRDGAGDYERAARAKYLAEFRVVAMEGHWVHAHPDVEPWAVAEVVSNIPGASERAASVLKMEAAEPQIWIYPDVDSLRQHSCASEVAVAYYDGAIHLAPPGQRRAPPETGKARVEALQRSLELRQSLSHEYVHHVLVSNGVGKPIWFQEGAATMIAGDQPRDSYALFKKSPPEIWRMTNDPEKAASLYETNVYYAQAYVMVDFLERLCLHREPCGLAELAHAIALGDVPPEDLFDWAVDERSSDLSSTAEVSVWDDYVKHGTFAPETYQALLHRARKKVQ